ncbi:glycosyltransferase [bacterium SCSIO 12741]|nr:glycosyltransferase [bacterium SCSIO 12741]
MNDRRHILVFSSWYPTWRDPQLGIFIKKQFQALTQFHRITVVYAQRGKSDSMVIEEDGDFREILYTYKSPPVLSFLGWRRAYQKLFAEIDKETFDLVHLNVVFPAGWVAGLYARKKNLPLVCSEHWSGYGFDDQYSGRIRKRITKQIFRQCQMMLVVSPWLAGALKKRGYDGPVKQVPNIIPFLHLEPSDHPEDLVIYNIADHIDRDKNISGLLKGFARLLEHFPAARLVQIGGGPDTEELKNLAQELKIEKSVDFKGLLPNEEVLESIHQASFGIINSRAETFSVVTFEFLAAGKPVVLTRCGGPEHYFNENLGLLIDPENDDQLDQALKQMSNQFSQYSPEELSRFVRRQFSAEEVAQKINSAYQEVWQQTN